MRYRFLYTWALSSSVQLYRATNSRRSSSPISLFLSAISRK
jgi:hypothetical protein